MRPITYHIDITFVHPSPNSHRFTSVLFHIIFRLRLPHRYRYALPLYNTWKWILIWLHLYMLAAIQQTGICIDNNGPYLWWFIQSHCLQSQGSDNTGNGLHQLDFIAVELEVTQGTYLTSFGFIKYGYLAISRLLYRRSAVYQSD